jgi:hypothetical protein
VALTTLNTGRLTLPANCVGAMRSAVDQSLKWANEREQWGATVGKHGAVADKIAGMSATLFAVEAMTMLTSVLVDRKKTDIRMEAAMAKMFGTEMGWDLAYEAQQVIGGRGYETAYSLKGRGEYPYTIERLVRDMRINTIFEGSSEIMRLFLAREGMDPHLKAAGKAVNASLPMGQRLGAALKASGFYMGWYPKMWLPFGGPSTSGMDGRLATQVRYVKKTARKLARRMFHAMISHGPKIEREQILLGRYVSIATELFAIAASCTYAQHLIGKGRDREELVNLVDYFSRESRLRIDEYFRGLKNNNDRQGYKLAQKVLGGALPWLTEGTVGEGPLVAAEPDQVD